MTALRTLLDVLPRSAFRGFRPRKTEPPPTKVEGFSVFERLRRTVEFFSD